MWPHMQAHMQECAVPWARFIQHLKLRSQSPNPAFLASELAAYKVSDFIARARPSRLAQAVGVKLRACGASVLIRV